MKSREGSRLIRNLELQLWPLVSAAVYALAAFAGFAVASAFRRTFKRLL